MPKKEVCEGVASSEPVDGCGMDQIHGDSGTSDRHQFHRVFQHRKLGLLRFIQHAVVNSHQLHFAFVNLTADAFNFGVAQTERRGIERRALCLIGALAAYLIDAAFLLLTPFQMIVIVAANSPSLRGSTIKPKEQATS